MRANLCSSCCALLVWVQGLERNPFGINRLLRHLVMKFMCALVLPMFLQVFSSSPNIPLQVNIEKNIFITDGETSARCYDHAKSSNWAVNDTEDYSKMVYYRSTFRLAAFSRPNTWEKQVKANGELAHTLCHENTTSYIKFWEIYWPFPEDPSSFTNGAQQLSIVKPDLILTTLSLLL